MSVVICITAGCGGQGSSAFAASLARALSSMGRTVAVVDAKGGAGALDSMLGTKETAVFNIGDVLMGRCELSDAVSRPFANAVFLAAAKNADEAPLGALNPILAKLEKYDYILIDMPRAESDSANYLFSCADMVILCSKPAERELRCTYDIRRRMQKLGVDTRLVLTMVDSDDLEVPDIDYCIDTAKARLMGVIPEDKEYAAALARGVPPKSGKACEAVMRIARRVEGEKTEIPKM